MGCIEPTTNGLHKQATYYIERGYSLVVTKRDKTPIPKWKEYQSKRATQTEVFQWLADANACGIAVIGGRVSDNLEIFDIDLKFDESGNLYERLREEVDNAMPGFLDNLRIHTTVSGGYHWFYHCDEVEGNLDLAKRKDNKVLIETRGEGGYAVCAAPGYSVIQDLPAPTITTQQRETLFAIARSFDESEKPIERVQPKVESSYYQRTPWEQYDTTGSNHMLQVLARHGWKEDQHSTKPGKIRLTRPGKDQGVSAEFDFDKGIFYVFTSSTEFSSGKGYSPSAVYTYLEHNGDFSAAAKALFNIGYGERKQEFSKEVAQYSGYWVNDCKSTTVSLSTGAVREAMIEKGFAMLDKDYVQVVDGVIYRLTKDAVYNYIITLVSENEVQFTFQKNTDVITFTIDKKSLITKAQKEFRGNIGMIAIPKFDRAVMRDSADEVFLHFSNKSMSITSSGCRLIDRTNDVCIFEEQIIKFEIQEEEVGATQTALFAQFLKNIAGRNYEAFRSSIGMMIRNYNGADGMRAVWLCDSVYESGKNLGRTGKGIFWKALSRVRKTDMCSGKDFTPDYQFKFQNIDRATQVYVIDDVKAKFDFSSLYNYCTEGVEYQKKHQDRVNLALKETPQLLITSNYPPELEKGSSTLGRLQILPLTDFYVKYMEEGGVKGYHKHVFFDDWEDVEWNRFYWFMADCVWYYLNEGQRPADMKEIRKARLKVVCSSKLKNSDTGNEFVDFLYEYDFSKPFELSTIKNEFGESTLEDQAVSACLKAYFEIENIPFSKKKEKVDGVSKNIWRT